MVGPKWNPGVSSMTVLRQAWPHSIRSIQITRTVQNDTQNLIERIIQDTDNKIDKDDTEKALNKHK